MEVTALQADERHGFAGTKSSPVWEAELIDPVTKFIISHTQGQQNEAFLRALLTDGASRLTYRHAVVLFSDGEPSYAALFPEIFGRPYQPPRQGVQGRRPKVRYRMLRTAAYVQLIKHRQGKRLTTIEIRRAQAFAKLIAETLVALGYRVVNTSAIERPNGTARLRSAHQTRKSLAFARRAETKLALGWWALTI